MIFQDTGVAEWICECVKQVSSHENTIRKSAVSRFRVMVSDVFYRGASARKLFSLSMLALRRGRNLDSLRMSFGPVFSPGSCKQV